MISEVTESTLASIRNPVLRIYAEQYEHIYQDYMQQVRQTGIEIEEGDNSSQVRERIAALGKKGAIVRNDGKSVYVNQLSSGCQACQKGIGSATYFVSLKCHRDCFYCFNPNQEEYEYFCVHTRDAGGELDALWASGQRVKHLALTGGEPLLYKDETIYFFQRARQNFPNAYTRLYTCGDHLERETLQALKNAGMNEIRFSIRLQDSDNARHHTYKQIALAREYIPNVMVEMPVLPGMFEEMKDVLLELDRLGIYGINLLEFCFPLNNAEIFRQRGYTIKARPYRVLYNYWYAGGLPVAGSETVCLDLIEFALDTKLKLGVHYCSLENKHSGQVYQQNVGQNFSKTLYFSQKDYFLRSAKVFGDDIEPVRLAFEKAGYKDYRIDREYNTLEFHVSKINLLKKLEIEIGISTAIIENRDGEIVLRELRLDVTTPQMFKLSDV